MADLVRAHGAKLWIPSLTGRGEAYPCPYTLRAKWTDAAPPHFKTKKAAEAWDRAHPPE